LSCSAQDSLILVAKLCRASAFKDPNSNTEILLIHGDAEAPARGVGWWGRPRIASVAGEQLLSRAAVPQDSTATEQPCQQGFAHNCTSPAASVRNLGNINFNCKNVEM